MINKLMDWMTNVFAPKAGKVAKNPWVSSVQDTMIAIMPVMIISSLVTIVSILNEYIPNFPDFSYFSTFTFGLSSIFVASLIPTLVLEKYRLPKYKRQAGLMGVAMLLMMSMAGFDDLGNFEVISDRIGSGGMFVAIVAGLYTALIMKTFSKKSMFKKNTSMPKFLVDSFDSMAPIVVIVATGFIFCNILHFDLYEVISAALNPLISISQSYVGFLLIMFLMVFFYSFGLSPWLLTPIYYSVGVKAIADNAALVAAGQPAQFITTNEVFQGWVWLGGTGCTLMLCFIMAFMCKSGKLKGLGGTCFVPAIFNINEPIVYGSVVFNPMLMIPMWLCGIIIPTITYFAFSLGLVAIPYQSFLLWYMPLPLMAWLTNHDIMGLVLLVVNLAITFIIYLPFTKAYDAQCLKEETEENKEPQR